MKKILAIVLVFLWFFAGAGCKEKEEKTPSVEEYYSSHVGKVLKTYGQGILAQMETSYGPLYVLRVKGTHYQMGYQYGYLAGDMIAGTWWNFVNYLASEIGYPVDAVNSMFGQILDGVWAQLAPYVPKEFYDEIKGIQDGADAAGFKNEFTVGNNKYSDTVSLSTLVKRILAIGNMSDLNESDDLMGDLQLVIATGFTSKAMDYYGITPPSAPSFQFSPEMREFVKRLQEKHISFKDFFAHCSFFAAWGKRTVNGHMIATRNLDWNENTGIANFKVLTVWMPDGEIPHVTVGYIGFIGALAGISQAGLTVSEVGSSSVLARLKGEPWILKFREILGKAYNLDDALKYITNQVDDGFNRPPTIGYNWLITYGDPVHHGKYAEAMNVENNGVFVGVYRRKPDCSVDAKLYEFDKDGHVAKVITHEQDPWLVNYEKDAVEIMLKDKNDSSDYPPYPYSLTTTPVKNIISLPKPVAYENGSYKFSPDGVERHVGKELSCAVYRGDEMMMHGLRMWQTACHGPWDYEAGHNDMYYQDINRLMLTGGSYNKRYLRMYQAILAYENGEELKVTNDVTKETMEIAPANNGYLKPIDLEAATKIARWAAMSSDIFSVAYDATALQIMVAFESTQDDKWIRASDNPYKFVDLKTLFYSGQ